jgi:hypothetical protein
MKWQEKTRMTGKHENEASRRPLPKPLPVKEGARGPVCQEIPMTHKERIEWLALYAARIGARLELGGECGFGRECVGLLRDSVYPDYPDDAPVPIETAYHKHPCLAVLGRGEDAVQDLCDWCVALEKDGFDRVEVVPNPRFEAEYTNKEIGDIGLLMGKHQIVRLVRSQERDRKARSAKK